MKKGFFSGFFCHKLILMHFCDFQPGVFLLFLAKGLELSANLAEKTFKTAKKANF